MAKTDPGPLIGAHMSIAGGVFNAVLHAETAGCRCVQLFVKSSNQWRAKPLTDDDIKQFKEERKRTKIGPAVAHSSYLINIATPDKALFEKSREALKVELERCNILGVEYLVFHPGAHVGSGVEAGMKRIADGMNWVLDCVAETDCMLLLETTAGAGSHIGSRFEELREIIDKLEQPERVGVCVDTCHIFSAGYDIRTQAAYKKTMKEFNDILGYPLLKALHFNDSKFDLGTHKDRHEHIGKGFIGKDGFGFFMRDAKLKTVPKLLETPKDPEGKNDKMNLALLRKLAKSK
ncbi:MAG: deoxyribonuclease IV [candidate division Zixibacteria bacterium]|nr:deoxyribonuclease IV [candidate division Zixibacteria bacterium]